MKMDDTPRIKKANMSATIFAMVLLYIYIFSLEDEFFSVYL